jgi:hypothetical protein
MYLVCFKIGWKVIKIVSIKLSVKYLMELWSHVPEKRTNSGPLPGNALRNKRVSSETKGQQNVRCMTTAKPNCWERCSVSRLTVSRNVTLTLTVRLEIEIELTRVETGSKISTVTLRVVGGDENGSLKSIHGLEYQGTRTQERLRWQGPAAYTKDRSVLSSERAPHKSKTASVKW